MFEVIYIVSGLVVGAFLIFIGLVFFDDAERINCKRSEYFSYFIIGGGLYMLYQVCDMIKFLASI